MRKTALIFLTFIFLSISLFFLSPKANAQSQNANVTQQNPYIIPNNNPDVPKNMHTWIQNVMVETMSAMVCQLAGINPVNPNEKCLGVDTKTGKVGFVEGGGGAIGFVNQMITALYTPPLHTSDYFTYLGQNFGLVKPAYAQGIGFNSLQPLVSLWTMTRNIVYLLFIIVFIVIGLAIMLRVKIDPRTVMTIENQIPKIIIGLIFVTFSLAIAGFLIDMMYVSIYFIFSLISNAGLTDVSGLNPSLMQGKTAIEAAQGVGGTGGIGGFTNNIAGSLKGVVQSLLGISTCNDPGSCLNSLFNPINFIQNLFGGSPDSHFNVVEFFMNLISGTFAFTVYKSLVDLSTFKVEVLGIGGDIGKLIGGGMAIPVSIAAYGASEFILRELLPWLIIYLIIFVAILWSLFRLWIQLLTAYIYILFNIIFAPFFIVAGLIPGSSLGIGAWLRDIGANLAAFPAVIAMFLLGKVLVDAFSQPNPNAFIPPLVGNPSPYTGQQTNPIGSLIGLGIILMTPQIVSMMKEVFKAPQLKSAAGIGQAMGVAPGLVGGFATAVASPFGSLAMYRGVKTQFAGAKGWPASLKTFMGNLTSPHKRETSDTTAPPTV